MNSRVKRITIGLAILEDSPAASFLPFSKLSLQFGQCQSLSGIHSESKQAAIHKNLDPRGEREREQKKNKTSVYKQQLLVKMTLRQPKEKWMS